MRNFFEKFQINDKAIAAGVSGGADSLALVLLLKEWASLNGRKIIALTVEHGLRPESAAEADYVASLMKSWGIEHHILPWLGEKPKTGVEEEARKMRYLLLKNWCREHGVAALAVAHHQRDQAETFLMRLQRGSGLDGLCGMAPVSFMEEIKIIRPLLDKNPDDLKALLKERGVRWVEDPSNQCDDYLRVRIRKFLPVLEKEAGIGIKRILSTMEALNSSRGYLDEQCRKLIKNHVKNWDGAGYSCALGEWRKFHPEMKFRILSSLLKAAGGKEYPPRADDLLRLLKNMEKDNFKSATLGGCNIVLADCKIWIIPEQKSSNGPDKKIWDAWLAENPQYKKQRLPYKLRLSLLTNRPIYKQ